MRTPLLQREGLLGLRDRQGFKALRAHMATADRLAPKETLARREPILLCKAPRETRAYQATQEVKAHLAKTLRA